MVMRFSSRKNQKCQTPTKLAQPFPANYGHDSSHMRLFLISGALISGAESAILNRESRDSESCDSNHVIPTLPLPFKEKARIFLSAKPSKSLEKKAKTHKNQRNDCCEKARKSKRARIGGSGYASFPAFLDFLALKFHLQGIPCSFECFSYVRGSEERKDPCFVKQRSCYKPQSPEKLKEK